MSGLRRSLLILLPLAAVAAGVLGWQLMAARGEDVARPNLVAAAQGDIEDVVTALGALQPLQYVDVGTQVSGQLQRIMVQIGSNVTKGDQLAQIDPTVYQARVAGNEAQLMVFKAQVADKQAQRTLADLQMRRQKDLLAARATSQDAFDIADANLKQISAQIDALQAQLKQTEATLEADRANLGYTKIFAPMAGTVVDILARQGQTLNANQSAPLVLRIADLDTMTVQAQVSEADVAKLEVGMSAYFTTLGQPDRRRVGKLRQILPTPTVVNNVVLYYVLFDVQNKERDLLPQMSAQVFFVVGSAKATTIVPVGALRLVSARRGERKYTVQLMQNGALEERAVEVGVMNRTHAEIKSGLKVGDQVAVSDTPSPSRPGNRGGGGPRFGPRI